MLLIAREQEMKRHLVMRKNETFVDVGANVGSYSLMVVNEYKDRAVKVIAIEAHCIALHCVEISNEISLRMLSYQSTRSFQIVKD